MYTHPEITRIAIAQRITERLAQAETGRHAGRARQRRKPSRTRRTRRHWPFTHPVITITR